MNDNLKNLYNTLLNNGYAPPSFEQFEKDMQDEKNLRGVYSTLQKEGFTPPSFDQFKKDMGYVVPQPQQPVSKPTQQPVQQQVRAGGGVFGGMQKRVDHAVESLKNIAAIAPSPATSADEATPQTRQPKQEEQPQKQGGWQPTWQEKMGMQMQLDDMTQRMEQSRKEQAKRMENMQKGTSIGRQSERIFNPETGKFEQKFYTTTGEEVDSWAEQSRINMAERDRWERDTEEGQASHKKRIENAFERRVETSLDKYDPENAAEMVWQQAEESLARANEQMSSTYGMIPQASTARAINTTANSLKYHDLQRMADDAWNMLGKEKQQSIIEDMYGALKNRYPQATEQQLQQAATEMAREQSDRRMYELAVAKNAPKDATEYFIRKVAAGNAIGTLMQAAARAQAGTTGDWEAREDAEQRFEKQGHKVAGIGGTVTGFALDPLTWASAGLSSAAVKGATWLGGKMIGGAAIREFSASLTGRLAAGVLGSAVNFGTYEAGSEALDQMKWGGYIDEETGERKDGFSLGRVAGRAVHGLMMGSVTGMVAPFLGNVSDKLVRATESTVGKVGIRAGELGVGTVAEGTIFAVPEIIDTYGQFGDLINSLSDESSPNYIADEQERAAKIEELRNSRGDALMDVWTDNMAMIAGFKTQHMLKSAPRVIGELAASRKGKAGFETRLRSILDGRGDLALTADEKKELERRGYGDLKNLTEEYSRYAEAKEEYDKARPTTTDASRMIEGGDGQAELPYNRFVELMTDNSVSEAARAKMYYYLTGHGLPMSTVMGSSILEDKDADGNVKSYTVESFGANGVITSRTFGDKKRADVEVNRINRQAELNGIDVGERAYNDKYDKKRMYEACRRMSSKTGAPTNKLYELMQRKPETMNGVEAQWADRILKEYETIGSDGFETTEGVSVNDDGTFISGNVERVKGLSTIRAEIGEEFGVDVDKAIRKEPVRRSEQEQKAVEEYASRLFEDIRQAQEEARRKQEEDASMRAGDHTDGTPQGEGPAGTGGPSGPDVPPTMGRIAGLLGIKDDTPDDGMTEAQRRGYDANADERRDIAIEVALATQQTGPVNAEAQEAWNGVVQRINADAAYMAAQERERAKKIQHADGSFRPATLKEKDSEGGDQQVYIVDGIVEMTADGEMVDPSKSDHNVVVVNPATGERKMIDPTADSGISSLGEVTTAEQREAEIERGREEYVRAQIDEAQGTVRLAPGDQLIMPTGEEAVVVSLTHSPASDGEGRSGDTDVVVALGDGTQATVSLSELQHIRDEKAVADYRQRHGIDEAATPSRHTGQPQGGANGVVAGAPAEYTEYMELSIRNDDGEVKPAIVMGRVRAVRENGRSGYVPDANGNIIEYWMDDEVHRKNIDKLNESVVSHVPVEEEGRGARPNSVAVDGAEGGARPNSVAVAGAEGDDSIVGDGSDVGNVGNGSNVVDVNNGGDEELRRQAAREDGQLLIQTSSEAAAALSTLPTGLSSAGKGIEKSATAQGKAEENAAMPMVEVNGKMKPDWSKATPARTHTYLYNERGLSRENADAFVENSRKAAEDEIKKHLKRRPKIGTDIDEFEAQTAEWQGKLEALQRQHDYWQAVQALGAEAAQAPGTIVDDPSEAMPMVKDAGGDERPAWERSTPSRGLTYMQDEMQLSDAEVADFIRNNSQRADKALQEHNKTKPSSQKESDPAAYKRKKDAWEKKRDELRRASEYWNEMREERKRRIRQAAEEKERQRREALTPEERAAEDAERARVEAEQRRRQQEASERVRREQEAREVTARRRREEAYQRRVEALKRKYGEHFDSDTDVPHSVEELIAMNLPTGISWESIQREVGRGFSRGRGGDIAMLSPYIAKDGRLTFDEAVHAIWEGEENVLADGGTRWEIDEVRNALIGFLQDVKSVKDIRDYVLDRREEEARASLAADEAAEESARDEWFMERYDLTYEEYSDFIRQLGEEYARGEGYYDSEEFFNEIENERRRQEGTGPVEGAGAAEGVGPSSDAEGVEGPADGGGKAGNAYTRGSERGSEGTAPLTHDEATALIAQMEERAEIAPEIELTIENWDALFGEDGRVNTPIGEVKMGENQFTKLMRQGRNGKLGMIKPTLETPDVIIEDASEAKEEDVAERNSSYVFVKAFKKADGSRYYYFTSVTVSKDGKEVVISNQEKRKNAIANLLTKGKLVWKHADDVSAASDVEQGLYSSQGNMSDPTTEGTDAPQTNDVQKGKLLYRFDGGAQTEQTPASVSVTTSRTNPGVSAGKGSENSSSVQGKGGKNAENQISTNEWNGHKTGERYLQADGETSEIIGFDYTYSGESSTPEVLVRSYDKNGNLTGTDALPGLMFDEEVRNGSMRKIEASEQLKPADLRDKLKPDSKKLGENVAKTKALTEQEATEVLQRMEEAAVEDPQIGLTPESWANTFGLSNSLETPIGNVKMGEGQYKKFFDKNRSAEFGMAVQTLQDPDIIFIEPSQAKEGQVTERPYSYVFVKSFIRNGEKMKYYASVTVQRDNMEVSVSSHIMKPTKVKERLTTLERIYTKQALISNSSDGHLAEQPKAVPDLLPTQENNAFSAGKGSENSSSVQGKGGKNAENQTPIQGLDGYTEDEVLSLVRGDIEEKLADAGIDGVTIKGMALHGSRLRGDAREDSDLDVVVEYEGDMSEDGLFNILNDEPMVIEGVRVDVNPITRGKSGTLDQYMERSRQYDALRKAERETDTEPTEAQKEAGNYKKGHVKIDGYDVTIENPKGSVRRGTDASGKQWEQEMQNTYGYIRGTEGVDGDHIDVFFSDDPSQGDVFVVDQVNKDGSFDEHKVMYGFPDIESARKAYLSNYEDGWTGLGAITPVSKEEFKKWINSSHRKTKPFAEYSSVKPLGDTGLGEAQKEGREVAMASQQTERKGGKILPLSGNEHMLEEETEKSGDDEHVGYSVTLQDGDGTLQRSIFYDGRMIAVQWQPGERLGGMHDILRAAFNEAPAENYDLFVPQQPANDTWEIDGREVIDFDHGDVVRFHSEEEMLDFYRRNKQEIDRRIDRQQNSSAPRMQKAGGMAGAMSEEERELGEALDELLDDILGDDYSTDHAEGQRVLDADRERRARLMGSRVEKRKARIASELQGRELTGEQQAVVDVFTGKKDHQVITFEREDGSKVKMEFVQGKDTSAGTDHSIFAHLGTTKGIISVQDILRIPDIIKRGKRNQRGNNVEYTFQDGKTTFTVYTKTKGGKELFQDFYSSWKVKKEKTPTSKPSITQDGENTQSAQSDDVNVSGAKLHKVSEKDKRETEKIFDAAKKRFGTTRDLREAGYILPDGTMLDFSGRHQMDEGMDTSGLRGQRSVDHRDVKQLNYESDGNTPSGIETSMPDFIERGAIRIDSNAGTINLSQAPTAAQRAVLRQLIARNGGAVSVDFGNGWDSDHYAEYDEARPQRVLSDIDRYFEEGIKPMGDYADGVSYHRAAPVFYSNAERAVEGIRQEKASPEQWLAMIQKAGGLKAGEDKWMGLSEWLKGQGKKTLTKDEVLAYIRANQVEVEEVTYADAVENTDFELLRQDYDEWLREEGQDYAWEQLRERFGDDADIAFDDMGGELTIANGEAAADLLGSERFINDTRLSYTTEGLENKREIALTVPTIEPWNEDDEIHFGDAGEGRAVAWVRFGETRDSEGNRVLVIDEIQSKRHQEGREKGYAKVEEDYGIDHTDHTHIPYAPFEKNWHELAMKRMLRYAAENGYDKVAWTTGEQQTERYSLGGKVDTVETYTIDENDKKEKVVLLRGPEISLRLVVDSRGTVIQSNIKEYIQDGTPLDAVVGKELALKIMQTGEDSATFKGEDLMVGGAGMRGFYDQMLPRFMDKYGKKWGVKTHDVELPEVEEAGRRMHAVDVTDEMRASVTEGQPMFFRTDGGEAYGFTMNGKIYIDPRIASSETRVHEYAHLWAQALRRANPEAWEQLKRRMLGDEELVEYVRSLYPEITDEDVLMEEVFTHFSGRRGAERLRQERERMLSENRDGVFGVARIVAMFDRLARLLKDFWQRSRELFAGRTDGLADTSGEDFADMMMADLMNKVDPRKEGRGARPNSVAVEGAEGGARPNSVAVAAQRESGRDTSTLDVSEMTEDEMNREYMRALGELNEARAANAYGKGVDVEYADRNGEKKTMQLHAPVSAIESMEPTEIHPHSLSRDDLRKLYKSFQPEVNDNTGERVEFYNSAFGKNHREGGLFEKIIPQIRELFKGAVLIYSEPENLSGQQRPDGTKHKEHRDYRGFGGYLNKVTIGGKEYYVRFTVQRKKNESGLHSTFVTNVDIYNNPAAVAYDPSHGRGRLDYDRITDAKLKTFFEKSKENVEKVSQLADTPELAQRKEAAEARMREILDEMQRRRGYSEDTSYQGSLAFNGAAPSKNAYFDTREERKEAFDNGDFEGDYSLGDFMESGLDGHDLGWQIDNPMAASGRDSAKLESIRNIAGVVKGGKRTIKMYRAVDADIEEGSFRNGDWVTPSRKYAEQHIKLQDWKHGRIIEQEVPVDDIWWNGDDINEWGYDDGKGYAYANTPNNRKLTDLVTYDDAGNVIPPSRRFDSSKADIRYQFVGERGAAEADRQDERAHRIDNLGVAREMEQEDIERVNERFNEDLQKQIDGTLPKGHVYDMGMPGDVLLSTGFPNIPIEMSASHLSEKAAAAHHPFGIEEVRDLVKAIQAPMAVFAYGDKDKAQNVIVEIQHEGKNFVVGIHFNQKRHGAVVSDIRGLYPKDNAEWLNWITQGKLIYADKEKIQTLIGKQRRTLAEVDYLDLNSAAKIVENFENPKLPERKNVGGGEKSTIRESETPSGSISQGYGSAGTSLNQVPAATKKIKWQPGTVNIDIGGGRFDRATEYLRERGVENLVFDPFNRDVRHNQSVAERVRSEKADTVTCNNVLNVIDTEESRANVILQAAKAIKADGTAYFSVYEGNKSGEGRRTKDDSWQNNRPTRDYVREVERYFEEVALRNGVITARKPKQTDELSVWDFDGTYNGNSILFREGETFAPKPTMPRGEWRRLAGEREQIDRRIEEIYGEQLSLTGRDAAERARLRELDEELSGLSARREEIMSQLDGTLPEPTAHERRSRQSQARQAYRLAKETAREWVKRLRLEGVAAVYDSIDEVPGHERFSRRKRRAKGWFDPATGKIVIVLGNHGSVEDVVRTILHEAVAHYGLRQLFGKNFDHFLDNVWSGASADIRQSIADIMDRLREHDRRSGRTPRSDEEYRRTATEEYLAKLAEDTDFEGMSRTEGAYRFWQKVKEWFLDMLGRLGLRDFGGARPQDVITDGELRYILWRSYKNMTSPGEYRNTFDMAEDMAKRREMGVETDGTAPLIEESIPLTAGTSHDEQAVRKAVARLSLREARQAYSRLNDHLNDTTGEDFADMMMADLMNKVDPRKEGRGARPNSVAVEGVDEETGNVMVYEPSSGYRSKDGTRITYLSLFDEMEMSGETDAAKTSHHTGQEGNGVIAPSEIRLRKLRKGETCHVERVYEETKQFDFTGKEKVESAEDVAYIFRQLENAAVENSFLVLVKDGRPTVIHLGVGSYVNVMAPYEQALVAYRELKPEQVYFVHNHPSGVLKASRQDQELLKRVKMAFGEDVVQQGIIIDTTSGKYGEFDMVADNYELVQTSGVEAMPQSEGADVPVKVYQFSRQVFAPDWNPESAFKIVSSQSVAEFVSSHRLGEHKKMSFLVVNNSGNVVANVFLPWTKLSDIKRSKDAGDLLAGYVHQCGGVRGVLYGNYDYEADDRAVLAAVGGRMRQLNAPLMDALHVEHSAYENGWAGVGEPEGVNSVDVRQVAQQMDDRNGTEVVRFVDYLLTGELNAGASKHFHVGDTGEILNGCGIEGKITVSTTAVNGHHTSDNEHLNENEWVEVFNRINEPIAVTKYGDNGKSYRIYTVVEKNGKSVCVGVDVKNVGRDVNVTSIRTAFARDIARALNENLLYPNSRSELETAIEEFSSRHNREIYPQQPSGDISEQEALLRGHNYREYPTIQELSAAKVGNNSDIAKENGENVVEDTAKVKRTMQEDRDMMRSAVQQMGEKLHTDINIIKDVNEITHPNAAVQERRRRSKGWYDTATGQVVIVLPNNRDIDDVKASVGHETIAHKGLRELVGEENYDEFLDETYQHLRDDLKKGVDDAAGKMFLAAMTSQHTGRTYERCRREAVDELFGRMAEKPFEEFSEGERSLWQKIKATVRRLLDKFLGSLKLPKWFELGDNELRYILWRSKERLERGKEHPIDLARDIVKREELGLTDEARYNMGDAPETFKVRQRRAVENNGTVMPGLNDAQVKVVDNIPRHHYTGNIAEATQQAIDAAKAKYVPNGEPRTLHYNNFGAEFDYSISGNAIETVLSAKHQGKSVNKGVHLALAEHLDRVIGESIEVEEHPDRIKAGGVRDNSKINPDALMHRFYGVANIDGVDYRVMTLMKEENKAKRGNGIHSYEVQKIEVLDEETPNTSNGVGTLNSELEGYPLAKVIKDVGKTMEKDKNLLEQSKLADESTDFDNPLTLGHSSELDVSRSTADLYRDPDETEDIWKDRSLGLQERITAAATRLANYHREDKTLRSDAMRAICDNLADLAKSMLGHPRKKDLTDGERRSVNAKAGDAARAQKRFDQTTVKRVSDLARVLISSGHLNGLSAGKVKRLLSAVKNSAGHDDIEGDVQKVMDIMVDNQLEQGESTLDELEAIRGSKVDARGVEVQGELDLAGQVMMEAFKDGRRLTREALEEEIGKALDRMSSESESVREDAENAYAGLQFALQYAARISDNEHAEKVLRDELKKKRDETSERDRMTDSYRQYVVSMEDAIRQKKIERAQAYHDLVAAMTGSLRESMANAKAFKESERKRVESIRHFANSDMQGMELRGQRPDSRLDRWNESLLMRLSLSPLHTFDQFMRLFGRKNADGKGYLYDHFVRKYIDSADHEQLMKEKYEGKLEAKVKELFGTHKVVGGLREVPYTYTSLYGYVDALPMTKVTYYDGAGKREYELSQAQLAYLYMVDKMPMGKATNRGMGVTEEVIEQIEGSLDAKLKEFVDWVQEEFLVELGNECNEVHKRMFGANMDSIENYFPFVRDKNSIKREVENGAGESMAERISTKTGAIIKRTPSVANWDMPNANFLDVLAKHVSEMCQWSSYAELNRDLGTLQSFNRFKQQVLDMRTIYGSGEQLWKRFMQTCAIAGNAYEPKRGEADKWMVQGAKGVVMGKIAFRPMTAMKQLLSLPAFFGEVDMECLSRDFATGGIASVKWAWENMPNFRKRIKSRTAGDFRLSATKYDKEKGWTNTLMRISAYGMLPNIGVDAWTIALGSHAVYVKAKKKYLSQGYSEEKAERRAVQDAELCFNKSQQSSEGAFMAPVQIDHTFASTTMMLFRNSSTSYTRECVTSVRNLKRMMSGEVDVDFMAKQLLRNAEIPTFSMLFDAELQRQVEGTLPVGHIYSLGMPGGLLQSAGFPDAPIELSSTRLAEKSSDPGHPFPIEALKGLVDALNNPVAVFNYGNNAMNVIVGLEYKGKHFLVGVHFNQQHRGTSVSDIRVLFPKDNAEWLNWISQGKARYLDHKRIKALIAQQRINLAEVDYLDLKDVAKVMESFVNPSIPEQKYFAGWRAEDVERAREHARKEYRSGYIRNSVNAVMFGFILPWLWRIGGLSILLTLGDDDDDKVSEVKKASKQSLFGPLEGIAYGDVIADGLYVSANKLFGDGTEKFSNLGRTNPFLSDLAGVLRKLDGDQMAAVNDVLNMLVGMKTGVNLQTVSDWATAILDYSPDGDTSREVSLLVSRLLNAPQSQIEKIYFDEIGMSGDEALRLSPRELVERYAQYKVKREHFVTPWVWGDEALLDKKRKMGKTIVKERTEQMGDKEVNESYDRHAEAFKEMDVRVKDLKKSIKEAGSDVERQMLLEDIQHYMAGDTGSFYGLFKTYDKGLGDLAKMYLSAKTPDEATLCRQAVLDYKAAMVKVLDAPDEDARAEAIGDLGNVMREFAEKYAPMQQPNR